jgi:hypothetical protein
MEFQLDDELQREKRQRLGGFTVRTRRPVQPNCVTTTANIDLSSVIVDEVNRTGVPAPPAVAKLGFSKIDDLARRLLADQGKARFNEDDYRRAVREVLRQVLDPNSDALDRRDPVVAADLYDRAQQILAARGVPESYDTLADALVEAAAERPAPQPEPAPETEAANALVNSFRSDGATLEPHEKHLAIENVVGAHVAKELGAGATPEDYLARVDEIMTANQKGQR